MPKRETERVRESELESDRCPALFVVGCVW